MPNWALIGSLVLPNIGGWAGALSMAGQFRSKEGRAWYQSLMKPSCSPPDWVFGPAWTALYSSMGYASYVVYEDCGGFTEKSLVPLALYVGHLIINWTATTTFFRFRRIGWAFAHLLTLDAAAVACTASFYEVNKDTLYFMAPYLAWLAFASYLNYCTWQLNKPGAKTAKEDKE